MAVQKKYSEKILANLANYGVQWNEVVDKIGVAELRETQAMLAKQTYLKQAVYFGKVKIYIVKPEEIDTLKVKPYLTLVDQSEEYKHIWSYMRTDRT